MVAVATSTLGGAVRNRRSAVLQMSASDAEIVQLDRCGKTKDKNVLT